MVYIWISLGNPIISRPGGEIQRIPPGTPHVAALYENPLKEFASS